MRYAIGMRAHAALVVVACACSGPARPATAPAGGAACKPAYAEYEAQWGTALRADLEELNFEGSVDEVVVAETATLPRRDDLVKLTATYKVIETFVPDAAWPRAYAAAGAAIDRCGEGAPRPR